MESNKFKNIISSAIMGFAVGDALGVPVEFLSREKMDRNPLKDMIEYGTHKQPIGTWSDDTSMVLATMDSIINMKRIDYNDIMKCYCKWANESKYTATDEVFDIGITTSNALRRFYYNKIDALSCGDNGERNNGNGSLMRMIPLALYLIGNNISEEESTKIINEYSSMTHAHEISRLGCKIYYDFISELINNNLDKEKALEKLKSIDYFKHYNKKTVVYYKRILDGSIRNISRTSVSGTGFVRDTLEAAIWATMSSSSYFEAVLKSINLGEDTDTVGAITGSINGIIYGINNIPERWKNNLKRKDYIYDLCDTFGETIITKNNNTSATYQKIISQFNAKRNEITFNPKLLDELSDEERLKVEKLIVFSVSNLNQTAYKYLPFLKMINLELHINDENIQKLSIKDRSELFKNLYLLTKNNIYYDYLLNLSHYHSEAFIELLSLRDLLQDNKQVGDDIKKIQVKKSDDKRYEAIYDFESLVSKKGK